MSVVKTFLLLFSLLIFMSCSNNDIKDSKIKEKSLDLQVLEAYNLGKDALEGGDVLYAAKKFNEAETLFPQSDWAPKSALMAAYAYYSQDYYYDSIAELQRFLRVYPNYKDTAYVHYLIGICYFEQIVDEKKDLTPLIDTKKKIDDFILNFPDSEYALDLKFKLGLVKNQMAAKEMYIARHYIDSEKWVPAINRLQTVVKRYDETIFIEEALYRLVEIYYKVGLEDEAIKTANILGYNYQSSEWYEKSYLIFNKDYKAVKIEKEKEDNLITRAIKKILR